MITSEDGMHFDNFNDKKVIIPPVTDAQIGDRAHTRDPKVWLGKGAWYMILGSTLDRTYGELLFYRSENLKEWTYVNRSVKKEGFGWMWECPDYFEINGNKVLIISPMGILHGEYMAKERQNQIICTLVEFEEEICTLIRVH